MKKILITLMLLIVNTHAHAAVFDHSPWDALLKKMSLFCVGGKPRK